MKKRYIKIVLWIFMVLGTCTTSLAQLCPECEEECEVGEEAAEDTERTAEIGGEEGEMTLGEADILGTEVGEEVTEVAATEVAEVATEELSLLALDAIPGVGEVLGALEIAALAGYGLYEFFHGLAEQQDKHDQAVKRAGHYILPLVPQVSFSVDDLNAKQDIISMAFFLKRTIVHEDLKEYLVQNGADSHINEQYPMHSLTDFTPYAFSMFHEDVEIPDDYLLWLDNSILRPAFGLVFVPEVHEHLGRTFTRSISPINFAAGYEDTDQRVFGDSNLPVTITDYWYHKNGFNQEYNMSLASDSRLELQLATVRAGGGFQELGASVPYTAELLEDQVAIRINNYDLSANAGKPLWILLKADTSYKYSFTGPGGGTEFPIDENGLTRGVVTVGKTIAYFRVRDYQARDTEESVVTRPVIVEGHKVINPFPELYATDRTEYADNVEIVAPDPGNTHLQMDIPIYKDWKRIDHLELEVLNRKMMVHINFNPNEFVEHFSEERIQSYYSDATGLHIPLNIGRITDTDGDSAYQVCFSKDCGSGCYLPTCDVAIPQDSPGTVYWLLENVPLRAGDVVGVTAFYDDGSLARNTVGISVGGTLSRAYYHILSTEVGHGLENPPGPGNGGPPSVSWLTYDGGEYPPYFSPTGSEWLVEHQGNGIYAIMERQSRKVLGMEEGIVGTFDWDPDNEDLLWYMEFTDGGQQLKNLGHQAYLLDDGISLGFSFSQGTNFLFEKTMDIEEPNLFEERPQLLINRNSEAVIGMGGSGYPALIRPNVEQANTDQFTYFTYSGCLRYTLQNDGTQKFLNYDMQQEKLSWEDQQATYWLLEEVSGDNDIWFTLKTNEMPLYGTGANGENSTLKVIPGMDATEQERNRDHFTVLPVPNGDLVAHYTFDGNVRDRSGYSHHGSLRKGATLVNDEVRGQVAYFDGIDDYIALATAEQLYLKEHSFTVGAWINAENLYNDKGILGTKGLRDGTRFEREGLALMTRDTNPILAFYYHDTRDGTVLNTNTWYYLTYIYDNDLKEQRIYVNGQPQAVGEDRENFIGTGQVTLGKALWGMHFKGKMDEVKIWKKVLTADEVLKEYGVLDQSLIVHYPFEGDVTDHSGYNHHGTSENGMAIVNDDERGQVAYFDGQDDYITLGDKESLKPAHLTVSAWVRFSADKNHGLIDFSTKGFQLTLNDDHVSTHFYIQGVHTVGNPSGEELKSTTGQIREGLNDNQWHHITVTYDGQLLKMYLNGSHFGGLEVAEGSDLYYEAGPVTIGGTLQNNFYFFAGFIDDLKIWNRALSAEEVLEESGADFTGLVAHYAFEGDASDHSGNEHHGAIKNGAAIISDAERGQVAHFDGVDDYVDLVSAEELSLHRHSYTVGAWVNAAAIGDNDKIVILGSSDGNRPPGLSLMIREGHPASGIYYNYLPDNGTLLDTDTWYYLTFVYDDVLKEELVYVNGEQRARAQDRENFAGTGLVTLGKSLDPVYNGAVFNGAAFKGKLDDVKIWNYPLNDHQIGVEYQQSKAGNGSDQAQALKAKLPEGADDLKDSADQIVNIYPNPTTGKLSIECTLKGASRVSVRLVDLSGIVLYEHMEDAQAGPYRFVMDDMNQYAKAKGVYLIIVEADGLWAVKKIVFL